MRRVDAGPGNGTLYNSLLTISEDGPAQKPPQKARPDIHGTPRVGVMGMAAGWKQCQLLPEEWVD